MRARFLITADGWTACGSRSSAISRTAGSPARIFICFRNSEPISCSADRRPLLPCELARIAPGVTLEHDIQAAIKDADVIMMLRVQLERQHETPMPAGEYFRFYGLRLEHVGLAKPGAIVMHPGPINRGREIASEVADSQSSVILNQVENGIAVRMAVLERILQ